MKTIIIALAAAVGLFGQPSTAVNIVPNSADVFRYFSDASSNLLYVCQAAQRGPTTTQKRSNSSLTNITVSANTATVATLDPHGLYEGARVTVTGATVDPDLNGTVTILTVPTSTSYTFTTANVSAATYNEATLAITTTNPLLTVQVWAIQVRTYDTSGNLTGSSWVGASTDRNLACTDRTKY